MASASECSSSCLLHHAEVRLPQLIDFPAPSLATERERLEVAGRIYTSKLQQWQTRILNLHTGDLNEKLVAELVVVDLIVGDGVVIHESQKVVTYTALSYAWGVQVYNQRISINGHSYPITQHLYAALQRSRPIPSRGRRWAIWVDALCINQHDTSECSVQVTNMMAIFWKASSVLVWLGEMNLNRACSKTETFAMDFLHSADASANFGTPTGLGANVAHGDTRTKHTAGCSACSIALLDGLMHIYTRPWLTRVWVRQEVWAAHTVLVELGDRMISWRSFRAGDAISYQLHSLSKTWPKSKHCEAKWSTMVQNMSLLRSLTRSGPGIVANRLERSNRRLRDDDLREDDAIALEDATGDPEADILDVLLNSLESKCSDPKDRIYGIVGMSRAKYRTRDKQPRIDGLEIVIDYDKGLAQVYMDLAGYLVRRDGHYGILYLQAHYGDSDDLDLPSWCPDWRTLKFKADYSTGWPWQRREEQKHTEFGPRRLGIPGTKIGTLGDVIPLSDEKPSVEKRYLGRYHEHAEFSMHKWQGGLVGKNKHRSGKAMFVHWKKDPHGKPMYRFPGMKFPQSPMFVPETARAFDILIRVNGSDIPVVLRRRKQDGAYTFIGPVVCTLCEGESDAEDERLIDWGLRDATNSSESAETYVLR